MTNTKRKLACAAAALAALVLTTAAVPARADDHDRGRREWREHEWRERHEWRPYYAGPRVVVAPPPAVYAPPPVIYAPPAPVYAPPPAPSVNFVFPLRF